MDSSSETKFGVLLVAKEATFSTTLKLLIEADFRVSLAYEGGVALSILHKKKRKIDLVMTETKLPDVCAFMFVQILKTEFRLPVVMLSETYHQPTYIRGLLNGAVGYLWKPLNVDELKKLPEYPLLKEREIMKQSLASGATDEKSGIQVADEIEDKLEDKLETCRFLLTGNNSQRKKRDTEDEGPFSGLPTPFEWTPYIHSKFLSVLWELGVYNVSPLALLHHINAPGLTMQIITEKLEKYYLYLHKQQDLTLKYSFQLLDKIISSEYDFPQPDAESPYFRFLRESGIYPDPFPWATEMLTSAEALMGGPVPISFLWEAPLWLPSAKAAHRLVPPTFYTALAPIPPFLMRPILPHPRGEGARENGN